MFAQLIYFVRGPRQTFLSHRNYDDREQGRDASSPISPNDKCQSGVRVSRSDGARCFWSLFAQRMP
jgi:hypothetical protein